MADTAPAPPDPHSRQTPEQFVAALRELRAWSGLSFRQLGARARALGDVLPPSTVATALNRPQLPSPDFVRAFVRACGLDRGATEAWAAAHTALRMAASVPVPAAGAAAVPPLEPTGGPVPVPAMLPPDIADFTARADEIRQVADRLTRVPTGDAARRAPPIAVITGMGGVGKTSLAVHIAHRVAPFFTDGQLYADLRGADDHGTAIRDILARFLRVLGVPGRAIPAASAECAAALRTRLAGRRVLILLDNAADEEQVRSLLPGAGSCAVVVTSRDRLTGLAGAERIELGVFHVAESVSLLRSIAGERVRAEPADAERIANLCAGLPLAVRIAGGRLAARPAWRAADLADVLGDEHRRLDQLMTGDLAIRASVAISYHALDDEQRRLFRLLAAFDVPHLPAWVAAAVLNSPYEDAVRCAEALVDAQLLIAAGVDGVHQHRYRFHELVRLYARERSTEEDEATDLTAALMRGFGGWLARAERMAERISGPAFAPVSGPARRHQPDRAERLAGIDPGRWFDAERITLVSAVRHACALGYDDVAFDLAGCMEKYLDVRGMYPEWVSLNTEVMQVCRRRGNRLGEAVMMRGLLDVTTWASDARDGNAMANLHDQAFRLREMFHEVGEVAGEADAAIMCSWALSADGRYDEAVEAATEALQLADRCHHDGGQVRARVALAVAYYEQGSYETAVEQLPAALRQARTMRNERCEATVLQFAGIGHRALGNFALGERLLTESLAISQRLEDAYTEVLTLLALGRLHFDRGSADARRCAERAVTLSREHAMRHHLAEALHLLGDVELRAGNHEHAAGHLRESVAIWRTRGWPTLQAAALSSLEQAYRDADPAAARKAFEEAQAILAGPGARETDGQR